MRKLIFIPFFILSLSFVYGQGINDFRLNSSELLGKISNSTQLSNAIFNILIVQDTIWLGTSKGLSRSTDNGTTWTNYYETPDFGANAVLALNYYNGQVWVSTFHYENVPFETDPVPFGGGLRYTKDGGDSWSVIPQPIDMVEDTTIVYGKNNLFALAIETAAKNFTYDIAFTKNSIWIASFAGGLRKSINQGQSWQRVILPPDSLDFIDPKESYNFQLHPPNNFNHRAFSLMSANENEIWCGTAGGINKSTDEGVSWRKFSHQNQQESISGNYILDIKRNEDDGSIWAVTRKTMDQDEYYGLSSTFNEGESWTTFLPGSIGNRIDFRYYLDGGNIAKSDILYCTKEGVYRRNSSGESWIMNPYIRDDETNIPISSSEFQSISSKNISDNQAAIWLGTNAGLARLTESSEMWDGDWKVFLASQKIEKEFSSFAFPNPFAPSLENTKIKYSTGENGGNVTIRVLGFGMNLVRTLIQNVYRNGYDDNIEEWNGFDENNNVVANGVYFYRIDINSNDPIYGKIMVMK